MFTTEAVKELKKYDGGVPFQINEEIRNWQLGTISKVEKLPKK